MNNTKTLAIVAVLTAATLVVGVTVAAATPSAFAGGNKERQDKYMKGGQGDYKKARQTNGNDGAKANGNTLTVQAAKQHGIVSGFDNTAEQEAQNVICTHPSTNCISEGSETPVVNNTSSSDDGDEHGNPGS
jgi:hypothetical protein